MNKKIRGLFLVTLIISTLTVTSVYAYENLLVANSYNSVEEYSKIEKSQSGLDEYKSAVMEKNKQLKNAKLEEVIATITFDKVITADELESYIKKHNIKTVQVQARALQADGTRVTIMTKTTKGFKATDEIVKQMAVDSNATFAGYISMYATVDSNSIDGIEKDNDTYLVDTSADLFHVGKNQVNGKSRNLLDENNSKKVSKRFPPSLTWKLEDVRSTK